MIKKKYTNELLNIILEQGFELTDFKGEVDNRDSSLGFIISLIKSVHLLSFKMLYFRVLPAGSFNDFSVEFIKFAPGFFTESFPNNNNTKSVHFEDVKNLFKDWLINHVVPCREELEYPNYWAILNKRSVGIKSINTNDNTTFDAHEVPVIQSTLEEVKNQIKESFWLNSQQLPSLEGKIEYLKEGVNRLNKTDWKGILLSTILAIAYDLSLNDERRNMLMGMFSKVWLVLENLPPRLGAPL